MQNLSKYSLKNSIAILIIAVLFFSCQNDIKVVQDFLADKNLPISTAENIYTVYKDSGYVTTKLKSPILNDYSNRKEHPYSEFPQGLTITKIEKNGDSLTVTGDYAINYSNTYISEIKGNVVIKNYTQQFTLKTEQVFWDQKLHYYVTEKPFTFITPSDTLIGQGFESQEDLKKWHIKNNSGTIIVPENKVN